MCSSLLADSNTFFPPKDSFFEEHIHGSFRDNEDSSGPANHFLTQAVHSLTDFGHTSLALTQW